MKVIELLTKIANGEEVPLIKYRNKILHWNKEKDRFEDKDGMNTLYEIDFSELNDEVEIIEEAKKIKKLEHWVDVKSWVEGNELKKGLEEQSEFNKNIYYKINEIIDKINNMEVK